MTDEELAERVRRGEDDLLPALWNRVRGLICYEALRFYRRRHGRCSASGVTVDDLIQEGYFAFLYAVRAYNPGKGFRFANYLSFPLKTSFSRAVGGRSGKIRPLDCCASLDAPIGEDGDASLADMQPDGNAGRAFEAVEDAIVNSQLREALDGCLSTLAEDEREVIRRRYYGGQTLRQIAEQSRASCKDVIQAELRGLRKLRHPSSKKRLMSARDVINTVYGASGLQRFRDTGYSSVELAYERLEAMRAAGRLEPEAAPDVSSF